MSINKHFSDFFWDAVNFHRFIMIFIKYGVYSKVCMGFAFLLEEIFY